ncbi:hypothetical protein L7F22_026016 [Adiantum nelumboides]|nr:hypothetical protein [Adiantum nelumboides]
MGIEKPNGRQGRKKAQGLHEKETKLKAKSKGRRRPIGGWHTVATSLLVELGLARGDATGAGPTYCEGEKPVGSVWKPPKSQPSAKLKMLHQDVSMDFSIFFEQFQDSWNQLETAIGCCGHDFFKVSKFMECLHPKIQEKVDFDADTYEGIVPLAKMKSRKVEQKLEMGYLRIEDYVPVPRREQSMRTPVRDVMAYQECKAQHRLPQSGVLSNDMLMKEELQVEESKGVGQPSPIEHVELSQVIPAVGLACEVKAQEHVCLDMQQVNAGDKVLEVCTILLKDMLLKVGVQGVMRHLSCSHAMGSAMEVSQAGNNKGICDRDASSDSVLAYGVFEGILIQYSDEEPCYGKQKWPMLVKTRSHARKFKRAGRSAGSGREEADQEKQVGQLCEHSRAANEVANLDSWMGIEKPKGRQGRKKAQGLHEKETKLKAKSEGRRRPIGSWHAVETSLLVELGLARGDATGAGPAYCQGEKPVGSVWKPPKSQRRLS